MGKTCSSPGARVTHQAVGGDREAAAQCPQESELHHAAICGGVQIDGAVLRVVIMRSLYSYAHSYAHIL